MKNQTAPLGAGSSIDGGQPYGGSLDELHILGWSLNTDEVKELIANTKGLLLSDFGLGQGARPSRP
jgi:hypothetical protein